MKAIGIILIAASAATVTATARAETRLPTPDESSSFLTYLEQRFSVGVRKVRFDINRADAAAPWDVRAWAEGRTQRAAWLLCLGSGTPHRFDGKRWSPAGAEVRFAWLDRSSDCGVAQERVELRQAMGDRDIVTMLEGQAKVLESARLLFAGNTGCAPQRALKFQLVSLDLGADKLYRFGYRSDRGGHAVVAVRKQGRELTAWNVNCAVEGRGP